MKVPNADRAFVDLNKLSDYALNPTHRVGGHRARLFAMLLGITMSDAEAMQDILLKAIRTEDATLGELDEYGQRYVVDFLLTWQDKQVTVRSAWIIRPNEDFQRLVTCYPL